MGEGFTAPRATIHWGREVIEAIFDYRTAVGPGRGVVRLVVDGTAAAGARVWLLRTTLQDLDDSGKHHDDERSQRYGFIRSSAHENWLDNRDRMSAFEDRDPEVLVVGGGHSGQMIAARLDQLGVDTLIVDKMPRVGDVWRKRYHSLALQNPTDTSHFPYLPFPSTFPNYLSKDKIANWLEFYADALDLKFWAGTEFVNGVYDDEAGLWNVMVRRPDGTERAMRPRHVVMAIGAFGNVPFIPGLPGIEAFAGRVLHTSEYQTGADFAGQNVLVVGVGTSGHDAALELQQYGAKVTMLQRGPITIIELGTRDKFPWSRFAEGASIEEIDLIGASNLVFPMAREAMIENTKRQNEADAELIERLERAGLRTYTGEEGGGWQLQAWRRGVGYYINVGASEAIADGLIRVVQTAAMDIYTSAGIRMSDGSELQFETIVLATGFHNASVDVVRLFGEEVAERIGGIFNLDDHGSGEWTNSWAPTAQKGLWFIAGGLEQARPYSRYLALQIKARLDGINPPSLP